ncbi:hypothetical protein KJY73_13995 [Bowmanella sp. Y26]|uniref:basic secretory protein-like protein n=1 Tax=Bowmanella yangjiangensis TaxID=2811230 RepID=UPI001BDDAC1C|nr:basic secretory protein-like protein [Bowmanella yangjiangensis]MBT1064699.1 hypothetical protein [Bowmanella yangjiangensis]
MNKYTLSMLALCLGASLTACNDGSGFTSNLQPESETQPPAASTATRNMTADSGVVISAPDAVNTPAAEGVANLLDGNKGTKFLTFSNKSSIVIQATGQYVLKQYRLTSGNDAPERDPASWILEGSNDGQAWQELDSRSGQSFDGRGATREFKLDDNDSPFQYFRFVFQNTSGSIFQLADLELHVLSDKPIAAFSVTKTDPTIGEFVIFSDQSLANPSSLHWQFEDGTPATSSDTKPLVSFASLGPKTVILTAVNDKGETVLEKKHLIRVWDPADPWAGFVMPMVSFKQNVPEHLGQSILEGAIPELETLIQEVALGVAKVLYADVRTTRIFNSILFETGEYDFPAAKSGTDDDMVLMFDLEHIANIHTAGGDAAVRKEIEGVLWHELTHGYNHVPDSGMYQAGNEKHSFLEGLANYVRIQAGFLEGHRANIGWVDNWNQDAYNQTSFFLEWVANSNRNTDFIRLFNQSAADIEGWSFDKAFKSIFGENRGIQAVFAEYQQYLIQEKGIFPPYPTPIAGHRNLAIGAAVQVNATTLLPFGEGPSALVDNHVGKKFNAVLEAPAWLGQYAPDLLPVNQVDNVEVTLTLPTAVVLDAYSLTTGNDNPQRDPNAWQLLGSNDGQRWTALDTNQYPAEPSRLTTYHYLLSGNTLAFSQYRFVLENTRQGSNIGGDAGRLIQLGELSLWDKE